MRLYLRAHSYHVINYKFSHVYARNKGPSLNVPLTIVSVCDRECLPKTRRNFCGTINAQRGRSVREKFHIRRQRGKCICIYAHMYIYISSVPRRIFVRVVRTRLNKRPNPAGRTVAGSSSCLCIVLALHSACCFSLATRSQAFN